MISQAIAWQHGKITASAEDKFTISGISVSLRLIEACSVHVFLI